MPAVRRGDNPGPDPAGDLVSAAEDRPLYVVAGEAADSPLLTVEEATRVLNEHGIGWSRSTVYAYLKAGVLPFAFRASDEGDWQIHRAEVLAFVERGRLPWLERGWSKPAVVKVDPESIADGVRLALGGLVAPARRVS